MNRILMQAALKAEAASNALVLASAYEGRPEQRRYAQEAEAALYAALDALAESGVADRRSFLTNAAHIVGGNVVPFRPTNGEAA